MPKPKPKRNRKYTPKPVTQHGGLIAVARVHMRAEEAAPLRDGQLTDIGVAYWLSLENLRSGTANEESWCCIVNALNIGLVLCEQCVGAEHEQAFVQALDGALRAKVRSAKSGTFRLDGEAMRDIELAFHLHDAQLRLATRAEVTVAMQTVHARIDSGIVYREAA